MRSGRTRSPLRGAALVVVAALASACDHSSPFTPPDNSSDGPLIDGEPTRLTYGTASTPAWTPDGTGIVFPFGDGARQDNDRCLASLPAAGGTIQHLICHRGALTTDTTDLLDDPAVADDMRVAFVRSSMPVGATQVRERWLAVAPWDGTGAETRLRSIPFQSSSGTQLASISALRWAGDDRLAFIGNAETLVAPCPTCDPIVIVSGREVIVADLSGAAPQFTELDVAGNPAGLAADGDDIYYVLAGDTRVYRQTGVTGAPVVVHDFVGRAFVRDIHVADGRLAAIADGIATTYETPDGTLLAGGPGNLYVVDLATGAEQLLTRARTLFSEPAVAPSGDAVAATGVPVEIIDDVILVVSGPPDIWRFGEP